MSKTIFFDGDPRDSVAVAKAVEGVDAIVFLPTLPPGSSPEEAFDIATRGMYVLATEAVKAGAKHVILGSSLTLFRRIPQNWHLGINWRPRPSPEVESLLPHLRELSLQEVARATGLHVTVLRFGEGATPREAVEKALLEPSVPWRVLHLGDVAGRPVSDNGKPWREVIGPGEPVASRSSLRKVAILGAGGPIGRTVADALKDHYTLRLADLAPLSEAKPQDPNAPIARPLPAPHEEVHLDVRRLDSVLDACKDCDAIINLTVVRPDPVEAFRVNALGAYNVGRAAAQLGIRRVVQTGPQLITLHGESDFLYDYHLASDTPTRPGRHLYGHSKFLGNEALRVLAEWYDLEVPNLMFNGFAQPDTASESGTSAMMLTWQDAARAIKCALQTPSLPSPYEEFHCVADFPHDQCRTDKAARLLGWKPQDKLEGLWRR